jgi:hypothetical protein
MCIDLRLVNTIFDIVQAWVNACPADELDAHGNVVLPKKWQNAAGFMLPKLVVETLSAHRLAFRALTRIFSKNREAELHFAAQMVWIPERPSKAGLKPKGGNFLKGLVSSEPPDKARPLERANFIQAMVRQVNAGLDVGATTCLLNLLDNNKALLESTVNDSTVAEFKHLIDDNGPRPQYMNFFSAICSCAGQTVVSNQEEILRLLLLKQEERQHYFLTTRALPLSLYTGPDKKIFSEKDAVGMGRWGGAHTYTYSHTLIHTLSYTHSLSCTHSLMHALSHAHSLMLTHSHTHTATRASST